MSSLGIALRTPVWTIAACGSTLRPALRILESGVLTCCSVRGWLRAAPLIILPPAVTLKSAPVDNAKMRS